MRLEMQHLASRSIRMQTRFLASLTTLLGLSLSRAPLGHDVPNHQSIEPLATHGALSPSKQVLWRTLPSG